MTVSNTTTKNKLSTNGVTVDFPFTFYITDVNQVFCKTVDSAGNEVDYFNFSVVKAINNNGGTLTTNTVLNGVDLLIYRGTPLTQETDYIKGGRFPADSHEAALDKLTLQNQEQREELDRTIKVGIGSDEMPTYEGLIADIDAKDEATLQAANNYTDDLLEGRVVVRENFYQSLSSGQLDVSTQVEASTAEFYVSDNDNDGISRRLTPVTLSTPNGDYTVINSTNISLTKSFNDGSVLTEVGNPNFKPIYNSKSPTGPIELIAHRGFKDVSFENTTFAMSSAKTFGAQSLEVDASISNDGVWYGFHDATVDNLTDGTGVFTSLNASYIDSLKYSKADGTVYEGLRVSKLDDILRVAKETGMKLYIEIKNTRNLTSDVDDIISKLNSFDLLETCNVASFDPSVIERIRFTSKTVEVGYLVNTSDFEAVISTAKSVGANVIINSYIQIENNPNQVEEYYNAGLDVVVYTANKASSFKNMAEFGVRKIMSDRGTI